MKITFYILFTIAIFQCNAQITDFRYIDLNKADSIALAYNGEDLNNLPILTHKLTSDLNTDIEKFRSIYKWVCTNIKNDYNLYYKNSYKRYRYRNDSIKLHSWNNKFRKTVFKTLLNKKQTICTGYAFLIKQMTELANIECVVVNGFGKTSGTLKKDLSIPNHSWNAVKLNNKWYLCDATWASGVQNPETMNFVFQYNDGFFLTSPNLFAISHYPENKKWLLTTNEDKGFNSFTDNPILYNNAYEHLTNLNAPLQMHHTIKTGEKIDFQFDLMKINPKNNYYLVIDNSSNSNKVIPQLISTKNNSVSFNHRFLKKGFYDVHLFIANNLIATYTVRVKTGS